MTYAIQKDDVFLPQVLVWVATAADGRLHHDGVRLTAYHTIAPVNVNINRINLKKLEGMVLDLHETKRRIICALKLGSNIRGSSNGWVHSYGVRLLVMSI